MSAEQLITKHLDIWTSAHKTRSSAGRGSSNKLDLYGIKKLRELILELAVRGKLVPQDPSDEPASELLKKIAAEKAQLIKEGKIKKEKPLPEITDEEMPYELPSGWAFVRLQKIINISSGDGLTADKMNGEGGIPVFGGNGVNGYHDLHNLNKPTIVIGRVGYYCGSIHITPEKAWVTDNAFETIFSETNIYIHFLYWLLRGTNLKENENATAQPVISGAKIYPIVVGLPPLDEQHRIVQKVVELMAFCDELEQAQTENIAAHAQLVEVLLTTLTNSKDHQELQANWQCIAEHFDTLFTTEDSIDQLKQTILQLAVMGKLVLQDPNDEPASELLKKIAAEKAQLIKEGKIKKEKPLPVITDEEKLFVLPEGWNWVRLDSLATKSEAGWSPQCNGYPRTDNKWGVLKVSAVSWGKFDPDENKELPDHLLPRSEYEVKEGDFLISRANTADLVAKAVVVPADSPKRLMMSDKIIRFNFTGLIDLDFIQLVNNSAFARSYYASVAGGTSSSMKNVSREQIRSLVFALPPHNEQKLIVAAVCDLMSLCENMKIGLKNALAIQLKLADTFIENAVR